MITQAASRRHIPALDGVRGLAVLIVFLYHYGGGEQSSNFALRLVGTCIHAGWCGVTLFFLLSGFLISGILWDDRGQRGWWRRFYARRTLRIFPLYYAALLIVLLYAVWLGNAVAAVQHLWIYALYLQNIPPLEARAVFAGTPLQLSHFWSLAVEEQFYLLWPFLLVRARSAARGRALCLTVFGLSAIFRFAICITMPNPGDYAVIFLPSRAGELALGAWLALAFRDAALWRRVQRLAPAVLFAAGAGLVIIGFVDQGFHLERRAMSLVGLPCITIALAALLTMALGGGGVARFFGMAWLRWLGGISYGVYVFHILLAPLFNWVVFRIAPHAGRNATLGLRFCVAGAMTLVIAQLSFTLFERPMMRLRRR